MNIVFSLIAIIGGGLLSLIAYKKVQLEKFISPDEAENWHRKFGKIAKILGPIVVVIGIWYLLF
ncbi:MAG: hypothetical protein ABSB11_08650 [Sedimentisphaerales bacterium]|jgi:hypothetical protein